MLINLTPNLVLRDTSDADIEVYNKVEMDYVLGIANSSINALRTDVGDLS